MSPSATPGRRRASQILRFLLVGAVGFLVDAGVLMALVELGGVSDIAARVPSFLVAVTVTWWCHRHFTFAVNRSPSVGEWLKFVTANGVGNGANLAIYWALIVLAGWSPLAALGVASIAAAGVNYTMSAGWVF